MKIKVEMAGGKGRVSFDMELDTEDFFLDRMKLFFDKALEAYKSLEETERRTA